MGTTRIEQAVDELDIDNDDSDPSCDDIRLAWLSRDLGAEDSSTQDFEALWSDR
jgi:hypothetical protein